MPPLFITGIGTGIGKSIVSAIIAEALQADYWKPVQAGNDGGKIDSECVQSLVSNVYTKVHPEAYYLQLPASPHIAAREEEINITIQSILQQQPTVTNRPLIIEGAGGIMVPLNQHEFIIDLIEQLQATVILVSRNYLGSINHSLLTAQLCKSRNIPVLGWVFNDQYLNYEQEIVQWSGYPSIGSIPFSANVNKAFVIEHANIIQTSLQKLL